ncbi:hypothetical protein V1511DRAFT_506121 [Dipodascopsis uninucleata]
MDFAPYQSEEPSASRQIGGSFVSGGGSYAPPTLTSSATASPPPPVYTASPSNVYQDTPGEDPNAMPVNQYETSLPLRLDWETVIAYAALPPIGSVVLLVFETKNDFVRFHAWQASLLFTPLFILYIILSFSTFLSWIILAVYIVLALYMAYRSFKDSSSLDRLELPVIGRLASDWVDSE